MHVYRMVERFRYISIVYFLKGFLVCVTKASAQPKKEPSQEYRFSSLTLPEIHPGLSYLNDFQSLLLYYTLSWFVTICGPIYFTKTWPFSTCRCSQVPLYTMYIHLIEACDFTVFYGYSDDATRLEQLLSCLAHGMVISEIMNTLIKKATGSSSLVYFCLHARCGGYTADKKTAGGYISMSYLLSINHNHTLIAMMMGVCWRFGEGGLPWEPSFKSDQTNETLRSLAANSPFI